jgi:hypothetical protein
LGAEVEYIKGGKSMSEAIDLIYGALDVFSGKKLSLKETSPENMRDWDAEMAYFQGHKKTIKGSEKSPEELVGDFHNHGDAANFSCVCDVNCKNCVFHYLDGNGNILERGKTPLCGTW